MSKSELLAILLEFDAYWQKHGTKIEIDGKLEITKPFVSDLLNWLKNPTKG